MNKFERRWAAGYEMLLYFYLDAFAPSLTGENLLYTRLNGR